MASIPNDMLFYFQTPAGYEYRSVWVNLMKGLSSIVPITEDEFWNLVHDGNLKMTIIKPTEFIYSMELPGNIIGNVTAFII